MAERKAGDVEAWIARPDPACQVVLLYGPDRGMVSERARALLSASGVDEADPFALVRLDAAELDQVPGRLIDEAMTVPMFSTRRIVWVRGAGAQKQFAEDVKLILAGAPGAVLIVIEAGELRKGTPLRSAVEASALGMALPCYPDQARSLDEVIDTELRQHGLSISGEARHALRASLGGDRLATRSELEKLALYCRGAGTVGLADVQALIGDVSGRDADDVVDALLAGRPEAFDGALGGLVASGSAAFLALSATMRQFQQLQMLRHDMDCSRRPPSAVVASARPPVFFARRKLVEDALQRWSAPALARALERLQQAVLLTRQRPELATATMRQTLLALLLEGDRRARS